MTLLSYLAGKSRWLRGGDTNKPLFLLKSALYNFQGKKIFAHHNTQIKGIKNIQVNGHLTIGKEYVGFLDGNERTLLNIKGKLIINGTVSIGKGCRLDIGKNAICTLNSCTINCETRLIIMHNLTVGKKSTISWRCELLDEDFHEIDYEGKKFKPSGITIGEYVWVGCYTRFLKGSAVGSDSVVASGAVVTEDYSEKKKILLAGSPAKVIKTDINWK